MSPDPMRIKRRRRSQWALSIFCVATGVNNSVAFLPPMLKSPPRLETTARPVFVLEGMGTAVETFYQTSPYLSAFLTCGFKASAADYLVQQSRQANEGVPPSKTVDTTTVDKIPVTSETQLDMYRNLAFLLYGGLYQGMAQQFMYNNLFPGLFGCEGWQSVLMQVCFDMAVVGPFLCLPMAYVVKSVVATLTSHLVEPSYAMFHDAVSKYVEDVTERGLLYKYWTIWVPVQTVTFGIVPTHFRVAFVAAVSFFWIMILSNVSAEGETNSVGTNPMVHKASNKAH